MPSRLRLYLDTSFTNPYTPNQMFAGDDVTLNFNLDTSKFGGGDVTDVYIMDPVTQIAVKKVNGVDYSIVGDQIQFIVPPPKDPVGVGGINNIFVEGYPLVTTHNGTAGQIRYVTLYLSPTDPEWKTYDFTNIQLANQDQYGIVQTWLKFSLTGAPLSYVTPLAVPDILHHATIRPYVAIYVEVTVPALTTAQKKVDLNIRITDVANQT